MQSIYHLPFTIYISLLENLVNSPLCLEPMETENMEQISRHYI